MSQSIQERLHEHIIRGKHVRSLVDSSDPRRALRADQQIDVFSVHEGSDGVLHSTVVSSRGRLLYKVSITPTTPIGDHYDWRWSCTCKDAAKGLHGPCKHTIAVAEHWLEAQARPMYKHLRSLLVEQHTG